MAQNFIFVRNAPLDAFFPANLQLLVMDATRLARSLTSKPPFIAIGQGSSGRIFIGLDVELPGLPSNFSIHAEQFLVANLVRRQEPKLDKLAISNDGYRFSAPCGNCCQFLQEIHKANEIQTFIAGPTTSHGFVPLEILLPQFFSPYNAFPRMVPDVLQQLNPHLTLIDTSTAPKYPLDTIKHAALNAAQRSYAPYTKAPSGVALKDRLGNVYRGSYLESVASIPSLGPVQAALVDFVINTGGREFKDIEAAVLVEKPNSRFSQAETARMIIKSVANSACSFTVFHLSDPADQSS